jgi:hypothetical protein
MTVIRSVLTNAFCCLVDKNRAGDDVAVSAGRTPHQSLSRDLRYLLGIDSECVFFFGIEIVPFALLLSDPF